MIGDINPLLTQGKLLLMRIKFLQQAINGCFLTKQILICYLKLFVGHSTRKNTFPNFDSLKNSKIPDLVQQIFFIDIERFLFVVGFEASYKVDVAALKL